MDLSPDHPGDAGASRAGRPAPPRLSRAWLACPAAFAVATCIGDVNLGLVFFVRDVFGASAAQVGWLAAAWSLAYVVGCQSLRLAFRGVRPPYLVIGSTLVVGGAIQGMLFAPSLAIVFVLHALYGLVLSLFWPPLMGWVTAGAEGEALGRVVTRFNLSWGLGAIVGPFACGWLSEWNVACPLRLGVLLLAATAAYAGAVLVILPGLRATGGSGRGTGPHTAPAGAGVWDGGLGRSTPLRYPAWAGLFPAYFGLGVVGAVFPLVARDSLGFAESLIGSLFLVRAVANLGVFVCLGRTTRWHFRLAPMLLSQVVAAVAFGGLAVAHSVAGVGALLAVVGAAAAVGYSCSIFHGASGAVDRARRMAVHESILALGLVVGSGLGGCLYQAWGAAAVYGLCAAVHAAGAVGQGLVAHATRGTGEGRASGVEPRSG